MSKKVNPYEECPVYETNQFIFRLVEKSDAEDLLECYSDPESAKIFNSDNCVDNFVYKTVEEVARCIKFWLIEYHEGAYVRFSIVDKEREKAIGTIEMFSLKKEYGDAGIPGFLRLDLASAYERKEAIGEILAMIEDNFFDVFEVDSILTKVVPEAEARVDVLTSIGYKSIENGTVVPYDHYFIKELSA